MKDRVHFSDEQLTAYLDGEVDGSLRRQIDDARLKDDSLSQRLESLRLDTAQLKSAFDGMLVAAPDAPDFIIDGPDEHTRDWRVQIWQMAAVASMLLFIGSMIGWHRASVQDDSWRSAAAIYHKLYVRQTLAHVDPDSARSSEELKRVSSALGRRFELADLTGAEDLEYKRAQVLGHQGRPLIQLAFLTSDGVPIALCIMAAKSESEQAVSGGEYAGLNAASWVKSGYEFLLLGNAAPARLEQFAHHFERQL